MNEDAIQLQSLQIIQFCIKYQKRGKVMRQQSEIVGPSFGDSLQKERQRAKKKEAQQKLDNSLNLDEAECFSSLKPTKNKCSSEILRGSQLVTCYDTEDCTEDYWKQYSNSLLLHDQRQPKRFQDIKTEKVNAQISSHNQLIKQNKKLNKIIERLTIDNQKLIETVRNLENQAKMENTYSHLQVNSNNLKLRVNQLLARIDQLEEENRQLNENDYYSWVVPQMSKPTSVQVQEKFGKKLEIYDKEICRLRNQLILKSQQIYNLNQNGHIQSQKLKQLLSQNRDLVEKLQHMNKISQIHSYKNQELDKSYHSIAQSSQRSIMILEGQVDTLEEQNESLKKKMSGLSEQKCENRETNDKIQNYCVEIDRLNKVLRKQIEARKRIEVQYDKIKEMLKLQNSFEISKIRGLPQPEEKSPKNEKNKLLKEIKLNIAKSSKTLPGGGSSEQANILSDEITRLESLLFEQQIQSQNQLQQIEYLEKQLLKYQVQSVRLEERMKMMEKQLKKSSENQLNLESRASSAIVEQNRQKQITELSTKYDNQLKNHKFTLKKLNKMKINYEYSQKYVSFLEEEIERHRNQKEEGPILTHQALMQIKQIQTAYQTALEINNNLSEDYSQLCNKMNSLKQKYKNNIQFFQNQTQFLQSQIQRHKEQNNTIMTEYGAKFNEIISIVAQQKQEMDEQKQSDLIYEHTIQHLQAKVAQLALLNEKKQEQKKQLEDKIVMLEKEQTRLGEQIKEIKDQEQEDIQELEDLLDKLEIYEQQLDFLCKENTELKEKVVSQNNRNILFAKNMQQNKKESELAIIELKQLYEREIGEILQKIEEETKKKAKEQKKIDETVNQFAKHIDDVEEELNVLKKTCQGIDCIRKQHAQYRDKTTLLKNQNNLLRKSLDEKEEIIQKINDMNQDLNNRVKKLQEELNSRVVSLLKTPGKENKDSINEKYLDLQKKYNKVRQNEVILQKKLQDVSIQFDKLKVFFMKLKNSDRRNKPQSKQPQNFTKMQKRGFP